MPVKCGHRITAAAVLWAATLMAAGQDASPAVWVWPGKVLDPARAIAHARTVGSFHTPLPEQYIWTAGDAAVTRKDEPLSRLKQNDWKTEPHCFRRSFAVAVKPSKATLYVAGPRSALVWLNGELVGRMQFSGGHHMGFGLMSADVSSDLRSGRNVIAMEVVRGYGSHHHSNALKTNWLNSGEVLAVKIVPAPEGVNGKPILVSDGAWRSTTAAAAGWQEPGFDDRAWKPVVSLGGIESDVDFFQWNADAGMYNWPGYLGEAPYMANYRLKAVKTERLPDGLLLDFGRELNGRIVLTAGSSLVRAQVRYGESMGELLHAPYLGEFALLAPAGHDARGPKSGFRYALVRLGAGDVGARLSAEGIYDPVVAQGSFECSDPRVNRIWETAVYTAHLSMQDSILDGIKRDRGRWMGDDEVIDRTIADVYGDGRLVKAALDDAIGPAPVTEHVNGLPGYSAWWVIGEAEYVRRWGDLRQLLVVRQRLLQVLALMERELNAQNIYAATGGGKPFVDWAPELSADSPEARRALDFEYLLAFRQGAWLLRLSGDDADAAKYSARADAMTAAARSSLEDGSGAFGDRWQTNAIAVLAGAVTSAAQREAVWRVLARTVTGRQTYDVITPYYGAYLLSAMAVLGHRREALQWMRAYWGGMLDAGATSFWEAWDPSWAGSDPHARLQADGKVGYNASLAHGWSSGPAAWLMEEVLGVKAIEPGFRNVQVRPELAGLAWVRGAVATPLGAVRVKADARRIVVEIPAGMEAQILLPAGAWTWNGAAVKMQPAEGGARQYIILRRAGTYEFVRR